MKAHFVAAAILVSLPAMGQEDAADVNEIVLSARNRISQNNDVWFRDGEFLPVIQSQNVLAEVNPHDEESWSNLEWMYFNISSIDMQWLVCRRFRQQNLNYADGPYYEAKLFYFNKSYAKVPALLEPSLKMTPPPDGNVFRFLAHSYEKMGYYEDSLRVWDMYLKGNPKDSQAQKNRDKVAKSLGR